MNKELSRAYATALYESLKKEERLNTLEQLKKVSSAFRDNEVKLFFENPLISEIEKKEVFHKALAPLEAGEVFKSFLSVVADKRRAAFLPEITETFEEVLNKETGITKGIVYSVAKLESHDKDDIVLSIEKIVQKKVNLDYKQDASLLGGLVAEVGSWRFDDSLKSHLKNLNDELNRSVN